MAIGPCKNPDCEAHHMRVQLYGGFCKACHDAVEEAKSKFKPCAAAVEPIENIEGLPERADIEAEEAEREADIRDIVRQHAVEEGLTVQNLPSLPEDLDRPFCLDGIEFQPLQPTDDAPAYFSVRNADLMAFNKAAAVRFNLASYSHAKIIPGGNGYALGIKFYRRERSGSMRVQARKAADVVLSNRQFIRAVPHLVGKRAVLVATSWDSFFVATFEGEE